MKAKELNLILNSPHEAILFAKERFKVVNAGRGFGKGQLILGEMFEHQTKKYTDRYGTPLANRLYYVGQTRIDAETTMWERTKEFFDPMIYSVNNTKLEITFKTNGKIRFFGSNRVDGMRGAYMTKGILDEFAFHKEPAYWAKILRPMTDRVRPYGEFLFTSTPYLLGDEFNNLYDRGQDESNNAWASWHFKSTDGGFITQDAVDSAKADLTYNDWRREYFAEWIAPSGLVYYNFKRDHHCKNVKFVPGLDIHWGWDFNVNPSVHSVLLHHHNGKFYQFDEICEGETPDATIAFTERYKPEQISNIYVYGDYTGKISTSGVTDYQMMEKILTDRGYPKPILKVYSGNPIERDRTNNVNRILENAVGEKAYFINPKTCPKTLKDLEQVKRSEYGKIDKTTNPLLTHATDALGYLMWVADPPRWAPVKPIREQPKKIINDMGYWV